MGFRTDTSESCSHRMRGGELHLGTGRNFRIHTCHRPRLECARANGMVTSTMFEQTSPGDPKHVFWVKSLKPVAIIGNTSRITSKLEQEGPQATARAATTIVQAFISFQDHPLMLESTPYLTKSATWTADRLSFLSTTGYSWKAVEMSAQWIGIPSTKRRAYVACV